MPIIKGIDDKGRSYYKFGEAGKKYYYVDEAGEKQAYRKAGRQGRAIEASKHKKPKKVDYVSIKYR